MLTALETPKPETKQLAPVLLADCEQRLESMLRREGIPAKVALSDREFVAGENHPYLKASTTVRLQEIGVKLQNGIEIKLIGERYKDATFHSGPGSDTGTRVFVMVGHPFHLSSKDHEQVDYADNHFLSMVREFDRHPHTRT